MKWSVYSRLSRDERVKIFALRFRPGCDLALRQWNSDFPELAVSDACFHEFINCAIEFVLIHKNRPDGACTWAREPMPGNLTPSRKEDPHNKGEYLISGLSYFGALCWSWRSPSKGKKRKGKSQGTFHRGVLGMIETEAKACDDLDLFLIFAELSGKSAKQGARDYAERSRKPNSDIDALARAIHHRVTRIDDPR